ncbi:GNAT family N-acetyltransferase [Endozoicomonas sp. Mp262]|uniref:GNAT family N-acetyltransferase n=1 Tax=Endozoicomonas sp. Mp262 TaxID=2919499 RepID=UPI0021DADD45
MNYTIHRIHQIDNPLRLQLKFYLATNKISRQYPLDEQRIEQMLQLMTGHPDYALWVAYDGDNPVGFISGNLQHSLFHDRIFAFDLGWFVLPGYQGKGIGRQLMDTYVHWAQAHGASVAHFSVVFADKEADQRSTDKLAAMGFEHWGYLTRKVLSE